MIDFRNPQIMHSGFDRPNLFFACHSASQCIFSDLKQYMVFEKDIWKFLGPTIIYAISRKRAEQISAVLEGKLLILLSWFVIS